MSDSFTAQLDGREEGQGAELKQDIRAVALPKGPILQLPQNNNYNNSAHSWHVVSLFAVI